MSSNTESRSGGIGFAGALFIAFLVLKLCKVIAWAWIWVFAPLWIPVAFVLVFLLLALLIAALATR